MGGGIPIVFVETRTVSDQEVECIWHRQTDTMIWWPQELKDCNSKSVLNVMIRIIDI